MIEYIFQKIREFEKYCKVYPNRSFYMLVSLWLLCLIILPHIILDIICYIISGWVIGGVISDLITPKGEKDDI